MEKKDNFSPALTEWDEILLTLPINEILEIRDNFYNELTKKSIIPYAMVLESFLKHELSDDGNIDPDSFNVKIHDVENLPISGYFIITGNATTEDKVVGTFQYIIPIHLLDAIVSGKIENQTLSQFMQDLDKLIKSNVDDKLVAEIVEIFKNKNGYDLKLLKEYRKVICDVEQVTDFNITNLSSQQQTSYNIFSSCNHQSKH